MLNLSLPRETACGDPANDPGSVGFDIKRVDGLPHAYRLTMKGFLAPGWTGRLTAGLARQRIGIVRGEAKKVTASAWHAHFELINAPFSKDPLGIDYLALAATEPQELSFGKISLLDFRLEPASLHEGSLYLEVRGTDRLGFLGDLLDFFSMRCLFPVKMTIDTAGDTALDCFWLRGMGGTLPSEGIALAFRESLQGLLTTHA